MNCYFLLFKELLWVKYMYRYANLAQFALLVASLMVAFVVTLWPLYIADFAVNLKNALVDGYILAYFDRATWITGCF